ncbi:Ig-like domain-containing protein [Sneathiella glossodoripedis]|uniref:Ig-like domain-containing protein n=1 Tax=Sneathiella glossodoripedis TaxID=418853 RepID=UPI00047191CD|nr:Ig-like domain-containing protein [Sneathiella glossodoripedis]
MDGVEVPVLIDDAITTDEDTDVTEQITADPNEQDFIPNAQTTTFNTPGAVTLTTPLGGGTVVNFAQGDWTANGAGDVWTLDLVDGGDNYGQLIVDASDPEAVTATLDIPDAADSAWEPMDTGDTATIVFDYSADVEGSESATVTINVDGVNDAPVAVDDIVITNTREDIDVPHSALMANDSDIDEDEELEITDVTPDAFIDGDFVTVPGSNRLKTQALKMLALM